MRRLFAGCVVAVFLVFGFSGTALAWPETQLTFGTDVSHALDNNLNFSPDGEWLAYDTRAFSGGIRNTLTLEKVNVNTGEIVVIHDVADPVIDLGPGTGAVSYFPEGDKVIAIHGLPTSTGLRYEGYRRFGAIFDPTDGTADIVVADARDVTAPFTPGALRGGSHRHEPSGDGQWIGFTYNDMIMREQGNDLRTIGVTKLGTPVSVDSDPAGENQDGIGFTALVVKVIPQADIVPDSDDIYQASDDSWVGHNGYDPGDGTMQRARAFIGRTMVTPPGGGDAVERREVYIVDIPEDITVAGPDGPLEGTETTFPMPPAGTVQRRLTFSDSNAGGIVRASNDGSQIAFSRADENGIGQIYLVSPLGGDPVQATFLEESTFKPWWHPSGDSIISISGGAIWGTNVALGDPDFGQSWLITVPTPDASPDAIVFSPDGKLIAFNRKIDEERPDGELVRQIFVTSFAPVPEPSTIVLAAFGLLAALACTRKPCR